MRSSTFGREYYSQNPFMYARHFKGLGRPVFVRPGFGIVKLALLGTGSYLIAKHVVQQDKNQAAAAQTCAQCGSKVDS